MLGRAGGAGAATPAKAIRLPCRNSDAFRQMISSQARGPEGRPHSQAARSGRWPQKHRGVWYQNQAPVGQTKRFSCLEIHRVGMPAVNLRVIQTHTPSCRQPEGASAGAAESEGMFRPAVGRNCGTHSTRRSRRGLQEGRGCPGRSRQPGAPIHQQMQWVLLVVGETQPMHL